MGIGETMGTIFDPRQYRSTTGGAISQLGSTIGGIGRAMVGQALDEQAEEEKIEQARQLTDYKVKRNQILDDYYADLNGRPDPNDPTKIIIAEPDTDGSRFAEHIKNRKPDAFYGLTGAAKELASNDWNIFAQASGAEARAEGIKRRQNQLAGEYVTKEDYFLKKSQRILNPLEALKRVEDASLNIAAAEKAQIPGYLNPALNAQKIVNVKKAVAGYQLLDNAETAEMTGQDGVEFIEKHAQEYLQDVNPDGADLTDEQQFTADEIDKLKKEYLAEKNSKKSAIKINYDAAVNKGEQAIEQRLYQERNFTDIRKFINIALPKEAVDEREKWYDNADRLAKAELSEKDSPFDKTMNPAKRQELLEKVARDQITHDQIDDWVGNPDGISIVDGQGIHKVLDDPAHIYRSPWAEDIKGGIDTAYELKEATLGGKTEKIPELQAWKNTKYNEMNAFIKKHEAAGTEPSSQQIQEFLNSTFKQAGSSFLSDVWKGLKLGMFVPPVGAARLISKKRELDRASSLDTTKRLPGETVAEYKLRKSMGTLDEVVKNE